MCVNGEPLTVPENSKKIDICHYDEELGELVPISISKKALKAHAKNHVNDTFRDVDGMCVNGEPLKA
jgi:hypothetical protein